MAEIVKSITVDLQFPIEHDGREIKSLSFRRMKAKDALIGEGETNAARTGYLVYAALAGVPLAVIEELDIEDVEAIGEAIIPLMGKSAAKAAQEMAEKAAQQQSAGAP